MSRIKKKYLPGNSYFGSLNMIVEHFKNTSKKYTETKIDMQVI